MMNVEPIRDKRKRMGFSQEKAAKKAGISRVQASQIERGKFTGGMQYFMKYLNALELNIHIADKYENIPQWDELDALFGGDDDW